MLNTQGDGTLLPTEVQTNVKFEIVMQTAATHIAKCTLAKIPIAKCTLAKIPIATWPYIQLPKYI